MIGRGVIKTTRSHTVCRVIRRETEALPREVDILLNPKGERMSTTGAVQRGYSPSLFWIFLGTEFQEIQNWVKGIVFRGHDLSRTIITERGMCEVLAIVMAAV